MLHRTNALFAWLETAESGHFAQAALDRTPLDA